MISRLHRKGRSSWTVALDLGHDIRTGRPYQEWISIKGHNWLVGTVRVGDMVDVVVEKASESVHRIAGIADENLTGPWINSVRCRLPWLCVNLGTVLLAALTISAFESTIARVAVLAMFLPVVAGQGSIAGTQTLTLVVRSMALGEISRHDGLQLISRELLLGLVHGILMAFLVASVISLWNGKPVLGLVVGIAMLGNMVVAGLAGSGVPLLLRKFRMDPAVSSAIFVTTVTDVIGFVLFLGMAAVLIESLD